VAVAHKHDAREALEVYGPVVAPIVGQVPFCLRLPQLVPIRARNMRNPSSGPAAGTPQGDFSVVMRFGRMQANAGAKNIPNQTRLRTRSQDSGDMQAAYPD
jgi:hypothetical protein